MDCDLTVARIEISNLYLVVINRQSEWVRAQAKLDAVSAGNFHTYGLDSRYKISCKIAGNLCLSSPELLLLLFPSTPTFPLRFHLLSYFPILTSTISTAHFHTPLLPLSVPPFPSPSLLVAAPSFLRTFNFLFHSFFSFYPNYSSSFFFHPFLSSPEYSFISHFPISVYSFLPPKCPS